MNSTSTTMSLVDKVTGQAVEVGEPTSKVYTFEAAAGTYVLTGYGTNGTTSNGTIEINVTNDAEQTFTVQTVTAYASNSGWVLGTDYSLDVTVNTKEGTTQAITLGSSTTAGRATFLALNGNSYFAAYIPSEARQEEGYMTGYKSATLTSTTTASMSIPKGEDYTVTVPADAQLSLGMKFTHFTKFTEVQPINPYISSCAQPGLQLPHMEVGRSDTSRLLHHEHRCGKASDTRIHRQRLCRFRGKDSEARHIVERWL
jgi:hypothetical protein